MLRAIVETRKEKLARETNYMRAIHPYTNEKVEHLTHIHNICFFFASQLGNNDSPSIGIILFHFFETSILRTYL